MSTDTRLRAWLQEREEARQPPPGHYLSVDPKEVEHQRWQDTTASTARHLAVAQATEHRLLRARAERQLAGAQQVLRRLGP
jgi:hypothetical protein